MKRFPLILFLIALCLGTAVRAGACNPEPGPHHFAPISVRIPDPPPPPLQTGIFEVFNTQNGLPCDRIRSLLILPERFLAGSDGEGLLEYHAGQWKSWNPQSNPPFPSRSVGALCQGASPDLILAGTPEGLVEIRYGKGGKVSFNPLPSSPRGGRNVLCLGRVGEDLMVGTDANGGRLEGSVVLPFRLPGDLLPTGFGAVGKSGPGDWLFGTEGGLLQVVGDGLQPVPRPDGDWGWVHALAAEEGLTVVGSSLGLFGWDKTGIKEHLPGVWITALAGSRIRCSALCNPGTDFAAADLGNCMSQALRELGSQRSETSKATRDKRENEVNSALNALETERVWLTDPRNFNDPGFSGRGETYLSNVGGILSKAFNPAAAAAKAISIPLAKGLWVGTQNTGLLFYANDGKARHYTAENSILPANTISAIVTAPSGETWIGTTEAGLMHYRSYTVDRSTAPQLVWSGAVRTLEVAGSLFVGTADQGLLVIDPRSLTTEAHYHPGNVPGFHKEVNDLAIDARARLWVAGDQGVWMRDEQGWHHYGVREGLASATVDALEVRQLKLVAACGGGGEIHRQMAYFNGLDFTSYAPETVLPLLRQAATAAVQVTDGLGFRGSYLRTLTATDPAALARYQIASAADRITALCDTDQFLWLGTADGNLYVFDGEAFKHLSSQGTGDMGPIVGIRQFPDETLLIGGRKRLLLFDGREYREVPLTGLPVDQGSINHLVHDDLDRNLFWIGYGREGGSGGVALYQKPLWKPIPTGDQPVRRLGLADPFVFFATPRGVYRLMK